MKLKEFFYMLGLKPKVTTFGFDVIRVKFGKDQSCEWALWRNPKCPALPRLKDYDILKYFLNPGDFAIDLGAHVGDTTLAMSLCTGKKGLVLALEPNKATYDVLQANAQLNPDITNIIPINAAAMDKDGEYVFQYNERSLMNGGYQKDISWLKHASFYKVGVTGVDLSQLLLNNYHDKLEKFRFIKLDLEGSDYKVFLNMRDIITQYMPAIQSELNGVMKRTDRRAYIQDLRELRYQVFSLNGETLDSMQQLTSIMIDSTKTFDIFAIPPLLVEQLKPVLQKNDS